MPPLDDPEDADPGLARQRTRLAWIRTAIAFGAVGAAILRRDLVIGLPVLAFVPLVWALGQLLGQPAGDVQRSRRMFLVMVTVVGISLLALAAALLSHGPGAFGQVSRGGG